MIAAAKPLALTKPLGLTRPKIAARKLTLAVRATSEQPSGEQKTDEGTVFYGGNTYASEAEVNFR